MQNKQDLKRLLINLEIQLDKIPQVDGNILTAWLGNVRKRDYELDAYKLINQYKYFPMGLFNTEDGKVILVKLSKSIPRKETCKYKYIPKNAFIVTFIQYKRKQVDAIRSVVAYQDTYGKILLLNFDKRFAKKTETDAEDKNILLNNVLAYIELLEAFFNNNIIQTYINGFSIVFPLSNEECKKVFKERDSDGRRKPIIHPVKDHQRKYKSGKIIDIPKHMAGYCEVTLNGKEYIICIGMNNKDYFPVEKEEVG